MVGQLGIFYLAFWYLLSLAKLKFKNVFALEISVPHPSAFQNRRGWMEKATALRLNFN